MIAPQEARNKVAGILAALAEGDAATARQAADEARAKFPNRPAVLLADAKVCEAEGRQQDAEAVYRNCAERFPNDAAPRLALARLLTDRGEIKEAASWMKAARDCGADGNKVRMTRLRIARGAGDWEKVRSVGDAAIASGQKPTVALLWSMGEAAQATGDWPAARDIGEQLMALAPAKPAGVHIRLRAALELGEPEAALRCYRRLAELKPADAKFALKTIRLLAQLGRPAEVLSEIMAANARYHDDPHWRLFVLRTPVAEFWRQAVEGPALSGGNVTVRQVEAETRLLRDVVAFLPGDADLQRPLIEDDAASDRILSPRGPSGRAALVFTSPSGQADLPIVEFDRYLAGLGMRAIYVRDVSARAYARGVASMAADEAGTVAALRDLLAALDVQFLTTIGFSDSALPAVRYGIALEATHAVCFGGQSAAEPAGPAHGPDRKLFAATMSPPPEEAPILRALLEADRTGLHVTMAYGETAKADARQAQALSGLPRVTLHAEQGVSDHLVFRRMAARPHIFDFLRTAVGLPSS